MNQIGRVAQRVCGSLEAFAGAHIQKTTHDPQPARVYAGTASRTTINATGRRFMLAT
jgi:hypothetical protein